MSGIVGQNPSRGSGVVGATPVADESVDSDAYVNASIANAHLADDAAGTDEIADNAVTLAKMAGGTDGNIISFDASGNPVAVATGNDGQVLTSAGAGAVCAFEDAAGGGKVLKFASVLSAAYASTTTSFPFDDTIPQNSEGVELVTLSFTPVSSSSTLLIQHGGNFNMGTGGNQAAAVMSCMFVDSTANAIGVAPLLMDGGGTRVSTSWGFMTVASGSTSARTYKQRWGRSGGGASTNYVNADSGTARKFGGVLKSGFYITEFEA